MKKYYLLSIFSTVVLFLSTVYVISNAISIFMAYLFLGLLNTVNAVIIWFLLNFLYKNNIPNKKIKIALFFVIVLVCQMLCCMILGFWLVPDNVKMAINTGLSANLLCVPYTLVLMCVCVVIQIVRRRLGNKRV